MGALEHINLWLEWYKKYQVDPRSYPELIRTGLREGLPTTGIDTFPGGKTEKVTKSQQQTGSCQYWVKGHSAICRHWKAEEKCVFEFNPPEERPPSGYGVAGECDNLGRRNWCDKYDSLGEDDLEEYICIVPCIEKSGLGKKIATSEIGLAYRPFRIDEIKGYNPSEDPNKAGQGLCDGWGMGRGKDGYDKGYSNIEDVYDDLPVCRHYRPKIMGFGAVQPRPFHGSSKPGPFNPKVNYIPTDAKSLHDGSPADPLKAMSIRLPFAFQVYNSRSMYQKCAHWKGTTPAFFEIDYIGSDPSMFNIIMNGESLCECKDDACKPYKEIKGEWTDNLPWILSSVWAPYKGIVCNGAKPECPCYTGKWIYCNDNNMRDGMRITADQILELRFWTNAWSSQEEYDAYYLQKPGPTQNGNADESTADIYTFTHWNTLNANDPNEGIMVGKKHHMCMPAPLHMREFDPNVYIKKTDVEYPKLHQGKGTNLAGAGVSFPTLNRELEDITDFVPNILLIYPYSVKDPWNATPCDNSEKPECCVHDSNLMSKTYISAIGNTALNKQVYVINYTTSKVAIGEKAIKYMNDYPIASKIKKTQWKDFCDSVTTLIEKVAEEGTSMSMSSSDEYGFFDIDKIELKLNHLNTLYIICRWRNEQYPEYAFKKVDVNSRYWAGLIEQYSAVHEYGSSESWYNFFPMFVTPGFKTIDGGVNVTLGKVQSVFSTYALYKYGKSMDIAYYSYCINRYTRTEKDIVKWVQVGPSQYIWAEIDDPEISYMWSFSVSEAHLEYIKSDNITFCSGLGTKVQLEVIYPTPEMSLGISFDRELEIIRRSIPPNAVLLKSELPAAFFNSGWALNLTYHYHKLETFMSDEIVWPYNMGVELSFNMFCESPFTVNHNKYETTFSIENYGLMDTRGSIKVMAFIEDENERVQAVISTKMLLQGCRMACRSVDIRYSYIADALGYDLQPRYGFFTWRGAPTAIGNSEPFVHGKAPKCGDHECASDNCIGPMWFPFNNCTTLDFYNVRNGAAECTMAILEGMPNLTKMGWGGWRYVMAEEYVSWVTTGGNWASSCGTAFYYHYSRASSEQRFNGEAKKKAKVDKFYYLFMKWTLPPFGNLGRGAVERFLVRDFNCYWDMSSGAPESRSAFMPMVFDKEDLFPDLNPFANPDEATPLHELFSHFSMLSNYTASFIGEKISEGRYRFDEIIKPVFHGNCMYPHPLIPSVGGMYRVIRYGFKNANHVWAWPEYWKPIERNVAAKEEMANPDNADEDEYSSLLKFITFVKPEYYFDYNKQEHRLITDEGEHKIIFEPPKDSDGDSTNIYPSVSIDGFHPRYFNIVYDEYTSANVDWKDESATGQVGSSGGDEENPSIYEVANNGSGLNGVYAYDPNGQWLHHFDTLFDGDASPDMRDDHKAYLGKDLFGNEAYAYYNRGLIANIPRNRLIYLPVKLEDAPEPEDNKDLAGDDIPYMYCWIMKGIQGVPLVIKIRGSWGTVVAGNGESAVYTKPGLVVIEGKGEVERDVNNSFIWPENAEPIGNLDPVTGKDITLKGKGLVSYEINFKLPRDPKRMTSKIDYFMLKLVSIPGEYFYIDSVSAKVGYYTKVEEKIKVWERMFRAGIAEGLTDPNADGPETDKYRTYDRDICNCGQYFPFEDKFPKKIIDHDDGTFLDEDTTDFEEGGKVKSKLNIVGFTKIFREDEKLEISKSNLKEVEVNAQRELYEEAFSMDDSDELNFGGIEHPAVTEWLKSINSSLKKASALKLVYKKVDWDHNNIKNALTQDGEFLTPGGHYFIWSDRFIRTRCYLFGSIQTVFSVDFVHCKHAVGGGDKIMATWETGESYAGWGRLHYMEGYLKTLGFLGRAGEGTGKFTDLMSAAVNGVDKQS